MSPTTLWKQTMTSLLYIQLWEHKLQSITSSHFPSCVQPPTPPQQHTMSDLSRRKVAMIIQRDDLNQVVVVKAKTFCNKPEEGADNNDSTGNMVIRHSTTKLDHKHKPIDPPHSFRLVAQRRSIKGEPLISSPFECIRIPTLHLRKVRWLTPVATID